MPLRTRSRLIWHIITVWFIYTLLQVILSSFINYAVTLLQAFVNIVLALCDAGDSVVMFSPYYFNSYMSFQMTGVTNILVGPGDPKTLHPDAGFYPTILYFSESCMMLHTIIE